MDWDWQLNYSRSIIVAGQGSAFSAKAEKKKFVWASANPDLEDYYLIPKYSGPQITRPPKRISTRPPVASGTPAEDGGK